MALFSGQRIFNSRSFLPRNVSAINFDQYSDGLIPTAHFHQPTRTFDRRHNHQTEQNRRYDASEKHPTPARGYVPRFIAHALNEHIDEYSGENSNHNSKLIKSHTAAANSRGSN